MGIFLLWRRMNTWIFLHTHLGAFKLSWGYVILITLGQHVIQMIAVAVNFLLSSFLIIGQKVNMATSAIWNCGLTSALFFYDTDVT